MGNAGKKGGGVEVRPYSGFGNGTTLGNNL